MAVTTHVYNIFKSAMMSGSYTLDADTASTYPVFVALVNNSYTFDADHKYVGEFIGTYEIAGVGYTSPGHALSNPQVTQDDTEDEGVFDAADWTISTSTVTARGAVLYSSMGSGNSADPLICFVDFGQDESSSSGSFTIQWAAEGIINCT